MGWVEMLQAPRGWSVGRGYTSPHCGRVWGSGTRKFFVFFLENTIF